MMWHRQSRPHWWPENEPWPPRRRYRHGPPRFVRRLGCLFALLVLFTAAGVALLSRAQQVALVIVVMSAASYFTIRRVSAHFRAQDRLRRQLMADVAHELRTPLAILQGRIEGVLDGVYARDDEQLSNLLEKTQHLSRLVEDLRTLANAEAGALELRKESVDLGELIRDTASSFPRPIEVDAEPCEINVDPIRIREVILNLLSNAVQHTPAGGRVSITCRETEGRVTIEVADSGSGIPPEELPRIFERFYKGATSRGSGLGLAIARNLVLAHGGTIDARSRVGEGTKITVTLPR